MKLLARIALLLAFPCVLAHAALPAVSGDWTGFALSHGQQVPVHLRVLNDHGSLTAALVNGPESSSASSVTFSENHLLLTYPHFARTLDATLSSDGTLSGTFGTATVRYPLTLTRHAVGFGTSSRAPRLQATGRLPCTARKASQPGN